MTKKAPFLVTLPAPHELGPCRRKLVWGAQSKESIINNQLKGGKGGVYFVARGPGHVPRKKKYDRTTLIFLGDALIDNFLLII